MLKIVYSITCNSDKGDSHRTVTLRHGRQQRPSGGIGTQQVKTDSELRMLRSRPKKGTEPRKAACGTRPSGQHAQVRAQATPQGHPPSSLCQPTTYKVNYEGGLGDRKAGPAPYTAQERVKITYSHPHPDADAATDEVVTSTMSLSLRNQPPMS